MAAPADKSIPNLNGKWVLNKTLSTPFDDVFVIQGVPYLLRKASAIAAVSFAMNQFQAPPEPPSTETEPVWHAHSSQYASGIPGTKDYRCLDGIPRAKDWVFGNMMWSSKLVSLDEVQENFIIEPWAEETERSSPDFILDLIQNKQRGWKLAQIWGFYVKDGQRYLCRTARVVKGDQQATCWAFFDYQT